MLSRRTFLVAAAAGGGMGVLRHASAQEVAPAQSPASNLFPMDQDAAKTVRRPPRPGARPSMTRDQRDELEHHIRCQCGCTLDVYTCRTTDFSCQVSPAMHSDVMGLVEGGYSAQEIIDAFVSSYGERALMAPTRTGFNALGWLMPFVAMGGGAVAVAALIRRWSARGATPEPPAAVGSLDATADELRRVDEAVRGGDPR